MKFLKINLSVLILSATLSLFSQTTKVLFIGNSLTNYGQTVQKFQEFADEAGKSIYVFNGCINGMTLPQHVVHDVTIDRIYSRDWDYVVLQGSNYDIAIPELRLNVYPPIIDMKYMIHDNNPNTKIIFFMDWAMKNGVTYNGTTYTYFEFQDMIYEGTLEVADDLDMMIAPIGWAWKKSISEHPEIDLFHPDLAHPGNKGAYLNACVYFATIFQESVEGFSFIHTLPPEEAEYLQMVGSQIVLENLELWNITPLNLTPHTIHDSGILLYPNPAKDRFTIANIENLPIKNIKIIDLSGKVIKSFEEGCSDKDMHYQISQIDNGYYLVEIQTSSVLITKKLLVNK